MNARYRLVESIGQGGMGRVWRAVDEILDRLVAVKEIRIDGPDAEDIRTRRERTLREGRATARIDHPNVVRVYDVVDEGERLWIVMELVSGRSLERIMAEEGPLGPRETARIGLGLVAALRQVHARGVLHRDIKPGNVLVEAGTTGGPGRVVLTDFGIAAIQDATALTMVGMLVGSPDYMAPERISGRRQGPPSDLWSLGATLCAALAGHSPFSRDTTLATLHAVLYEEPELPTSPGPLRALLAALLSKDPSARPTLTTLETTLRLTADPPPPPTLPAAPTLPPPDATPTTAPTPSAENGGFGADAALGAGAAGSSTAPGPPGAKATIAAPPGPERPEPTPTPAEHDARAGAAERQPTAEPPASAGSGVDGGGRRPGSPSAAGEGGAGRDASGPVRTAVEPQALGGAGVDGGGRRPGSPSAAGDGGGGREASGSGRAVAGPQALGGAGVDGGGRRAGSPSVAGVEGAARQDASAPGRSAVAPGEREAPGAERLGRRARGPEAAGAVTVGAGAPTQPSGFPVGTGGPVTELRPAAPFEEPGRAEGPAGPHRHRTALLAVLGVVAVGVVVAVLLAASGGGGRRGAAHGATGGVASRGGSAAASRAGPDASASSPSATPTDSAGGSPTADGTGTPTGAPPGGRVEAGGFAWVPPRGWRRDVKTGAEVHYTSPDGRQELVAKSSLARGDLWETWQQSERDARQGRDYVRVRLARTSFQGHPAVVWEYTFTLKGTPWHARLLGFDADGKSYQVNTWYQPEIETGAVQTYSTVKETFTVL
ncbi:protein kinase [Streptomyces collinus]|uniref:serine/threonine-protein kinase n=1 Tax=Streptomyces collinus TaxID=42684 RepID=UPI00362CCA68